MVTIFDALAEGAKILREKGIETPRLDSEVIMSHILSCSRLKLLTCSDETLSGSDYESFFQLIRRRSNGEPSAYLIGMKEFMGFNFEVRPGVLVPRADTETVVERALDECRKHDEVIKVADVGCGSGAIGISIAKLAQNTTVTLIDIDDIPVEISTKNALLNGVGDRVKVQKGNLLDGIGSEELDMVISNPPYIETGVIRTLQRDVKEYEPYIALDGGNDGLKFYRSITPEAVRCLKIGGALIYEIGYDQGESVREILKMNNFSSIEVIKDLSGNDRCIFGRK